jgi:hypothetical protein
MLKEDILGESRLLQTAYLDSILEYAEPSRHETSKAYLK